MFKVLSQHLRGILATAFETHLAVEDFSATDQQISWTKNGRRCSENCQLYKSLSLFYEEHFTILYSSFCHSLFTFLPFDIFWYVGVHPVSLRFFIRTSKTFIELSVFFLRFISAKYSYYVFIFHETFAPGNDKNYSWR